MTAATHTPEPNAPDPNAPDPNAPDPHTAEPTTPEPTTPEPTTPGSPTWHADVLDGWVARDLALPAGAIATLVRPAEPVPATLGHPAVLYVHGFCDYFFQTHMAGALISHGYPFYAVDLRGYGRSIGRGSGAPAAAGDDPNYVTNLAVYAQDLDAAVRVIRAEGHTRLVVVGHSEGGLITSLWANARPGTLDALVLNSPWFDLNLNWFNRTVTARAIGAVGQVAPHLVVSHLSPHYGRGLHRDTGGEWDYNLEWKPLAGFPVHAGWLREIRRAQARLARGLDIDCPVLVASSARSGSAVHWHPDVVTTDSVLDVEQIRSRAPLLGPDVTQVVIDGGAHDLALSPRPARDQYLTEVLTWLDAKTAPTS